MATRLRGGLFVQDAGGDLQRDQELTVLRRPLSLPLPDTERGGKSESALPWYWSPAYLRTVLSRRLNTNCKMD